MTSVICFGTFDHLHPGHLNYFQQAKELGDYLIVIVARDKNTNRETTFNEEERLAEVKKQEVVDEAILGDLEDKYKDAIEEVCNSSKLLKYYYYYYFFKILN